MIQIVLAQAGELSPWKGGGFGMFSTVESPASRVVKARLITPDDSIRVSIPKRFRREQRRIRTRPTEEGVYRLARGLSQTTWVPYVLEPADVRYRRLGGNPDGSAHPDSLVAILNTVFARLRMVRPKAEGEDFALPVEVLAVEVTCYQIRFDGTTETLTLDPIAMATYHVD